MKVRKNLEAVFLAASVMVTFAAYATADVPVRANAAPASASAVADSNMTVVVVSAKRLSAAEKVAQQ
ncbi:hypothetical protein [Massilia aquatica]|uniref:Uncharacterized protein n=1 Tax=Massilia aquatica TaxID=2609000 RepID=A0ABX0MF34_9BURK|nr:hypothetical protein [Massilia aquatica]NHZ43387.1 hypothetical protein [Massilia aquatica]